MNTLKTIVMGVGVLLWAHSASAQEISLSDCQNLKDRIEQYDALRKRGASAQQMESWKRSREDLKDKFRRNHCRKWGSELS